MVVVVGAVDVVVEGSVIDVTGGGGTVESLTTTAPSPEQPADTTAIARMETMKNRCILR